MDRIIEFANNHTLLVLGLVASLLLVVFTEIRRMAGAVLAVQPSDAVKLMNNDAAVIDLRNAEAYANGHIVNARNVPYDELDGRMEKLAALKSKPVVAVCETGTPSGKAAATLRKAGFDSVYSLKGGMTAWNQAGLPIVSGRKTKSKK